MESFDAGLLKRFNNKALIIDILIILEVLGRRAFIVSVIIDTNKRTTIARSILIDIALIITSFELILKILIRYLA